MKRIGTLVDGKVFDLQSKKDGEPIYRDSPLALNIIRYSMAQILAHAIKRLYKDAIFTYGKVTDYGFSYDFKIDTTIGLKDLSIIEKEMNKIVEEDIKTNRETVKRETFEVIYNNELLKDLDELKNEHVEIYHQGDFFHLCMGLHVNHTGLIGNAFKLINISEITWRGHKLQRIEGIGFTNPLDLDQYLIYLESCKENDHRLLGKELDLFLTGEEAPGQVFWLPRGVKLLNKFKEFLREYYYYDCEEVISPVILKNELWLKTGHLPKYEENMFLFDDCALKPMSCPGHSLIFKKKTRSYKDLPLRFAEFGSCFRNEERGALCGLKRVLNFTQDDCHIFCEEYMIQSEISKFIDKVIKIYNKLFIFDIFFTVSTRPAKRIGDDNVWNQSEQALINTLKYKELPFTINEGDGAFYGPKIDIYIRDNMKKLWQCGTAQVDFFMGTNLDLQFINDKGTHEHPIVIHTAAFGSIERFMAMLLENNGGELPFFILPTQVVLIDMGVKDYCEKIKKDLKDFSVSIDDSDLDLRNKIKKWHNLKIPYICVLGEKELKEGNVSVRIENKIKTFTIEELKILLKSL